MRAGRRIVAGLVAALLAAAGIIAVIEIVSAAAGGAPVVVGWPGWAARLADAVWSDRSVRLTAAVGALIGLLLLGFGVRAGRPTRLAVRETSTGTSVFVDRRGLARALRSAALTVDGVTAARARVRRRTAEVRLRLRPRTAGGAPDRVADVLTGLLASFDLAQPCELRVWARTGGDRRAGDNLVPEPPPPPEPPEPPEAPEASEPPVSAAAGERSRPAVSGGTRRGGTS